VALTAIFGSLAVLSLVLLLWQWIVALRFPLHQRNPDTSFQPGVTLLKPLKGCDSMTEECLRSWFTQDYRGSVQILFGVASADDPVCAIVRDLISQYPAADTQLIICGPLLGTNAKVSKLLQLERLAKHDLLVISDADVRVPRDLLANVVAPFAASNPGSATDDAERRCLSRSRPESPEALESSAPRGYVGAAAAETAALRKPTKCIPGLVNCFYSLANPTTLAMQCEAVAINADFWTQVLQAQSLKPLDFALGAVMVTTRQDLKSIGSLARLANCLADDYQLGNRIARTGKLVALSNVPVECFSEPMNWSAVWKHQMRWARTIRVSRPVPYFFSILSNPTLWPILWLAIAPGSLAAVFTALVLVTRILMALTSQARLTKRKTHPGYWWLVPIKDLLQAVIWAGAFMGNTVEWRGQRMKLLPNGELENA
jgi:ceramide glucosyltransferase